MTLTLGLAQRIAQERAKYGVQRRLSKSEAGKQVWTDTGFLVALRIACAPRHHVPRDLVDPRRGARGTRNPFPIRGLRPQAAALLR